jgi:hypothetical protein
MRRFCGPTLREDPARRNDYLAERADTASRIRITSPAIIAGAMKRAAVLDELSRIGIPTLVITGDAQQRSRRRDASREERRRREVDEIALYHEEKSLPLLAGGSQ